VEAKQIAFESVKVKGMNELCQTDPSIFGLVQIATSKVLKDHLATEDPNGQQAHRAIVLQ
jgi:hypothetical protein